MSKFIQSIVRIATAEIGVKEIGNSNKGPRVNQYKAATNLPPEEAWPWCAGFVAWVVREAMKENNIKETRTFKRPTTAGAWDLLNWSKAQDNTTSTKAYPKNDIKAGDIVVFTFSHTGIAVEDAKNGMVVCVEGNTNEAGVRDGGGVFKKTRPVSKVRGRIRFTI